MAEDSDFLDQISEALDQIEKAATIIGVDRTTGAQTLFFSGDDPDGPVLHVPIDWHTREPAALIALCRRLKGRCDYDMSSGARAGSSRS